MNTPEPTRRKLNPETPVPKTVSKIKLEPISSPQWDMELDEDDTFIKSDLDKINKLLEQAAHEDNQDNN